MLTDAIFSDGFVYGESVQIYYIYLSICLRMYVCVSVCMYGGMYVSIYLCMYLCIYLSICHEKLLTAVIHNITKFIHAIYSNDFIDYCDMCAVH